MRAGQFDTQNATNGWGGELALYPGAAVRPRQIADRQGAAPLQNLPEGQCTQLGRSCRWRFDPAVTAVCWFPVIGGER
jgi:hypothetical protein